MTEETPATGAAMPGDRQPEASEVTAALPIVPAQAAPPAVETPPADGNPDPVESPLLHPTAALEVVVPVGAARVESVPAIPDVMGAEEHAYEVPGRRRPAVMAGAAVVLALVIGVVVYMTGEKGGPRDSAGATWLPVPTPAATSPAASPSASPSPSLSPSASASASAKPLLVGPQPVKISAQGWWSWSLMDLRTGRIYGSSNLHETSRTASMIKAWIGADFLRREAEAGRTPSAYRLGQVVTMIRDSDNTAATSLFSAVGQSASTRRMISMCGLKDSAAFDNWSNTLVSTSDTVRLGACIDSGKAAGKKWTPYLLNEMRHVRGEGNFGIRKAFPASIQGTIAIKNGWVIRNAANEWNVNCLAIGDGWSMAVETRYPASLGMSYGASICKQVASQLRL